MRTVSDDIFDAKCQVHKDKANPFLKEISLTTAILTVIFMALVVIYQLTCSHHDLAQDLNVVFSNYRK